MLVNFQVNETKNLTLFAYNTSNYFQLRSSTESNLKLYLEKQLRGMVFVSISLFKV